MVVNMINKKERYTSAPKAQTARNKFTYTYNSKRYLKFRDAGDIRQQNNIYNS